MNYKFILVRNNKKRDPFYRIFVKHIHKNIIIDKIGFYNPLSKINQNDKKKKQFYFNLGKFLKWRKKGCNFSNFLISKIIYWLLFLKLKTKKN